MSTHSIISYLIIKVNIDFMFILFILMCLVYVHSSESLRVKKKKIRVNQVRGKKGILEGLKTPSNLIPTKFILIS